MIPLTPILRSAQGFLLALLGCHAVAGEPDWALSLERELAAGTRCADQQALRTLDIGQAMHELYRANAFAPLWLDASRLAALQRELAQLEGDGLLIHDYADALAAAPPDDACAEMRLSSHYLLALEQLSQGRVDLPRIEPRWQAGSSLQNPSRGIVELAQLGTQDPGRAFDAARPALPLYRELRSAFVRMLQAQRRWEPIPGGATLGPGAVDPRVALVAQRLFDEGFIEDEWLFDRRQSSAPSRYGPELEQAVRDFQEWHGIEADGLVGRQTLAVLNLAPEGRALKLRINLERLRWLDAKRGNYMLLVNIAAGDIRLYRDDAVIWQSRVLSGRPERSTPLLVSRIDRITFNPAWTVPPTIMREDKLPLISADIRYLADNDLDVLDYGGQPVDPAAVDWTNPGRILLRQAPGPDNPLGAMAFRLQNPYSIYLHDTPARNLFKSDSPNVSSGCVRVEDAEGLAGHLLANRSMEEHQAIVRLREDGQTHEVDVREGPQLMISYWTAEAYAGRVRFFRDPYDLDRALLDAFSALGSVNGHVVIRPHR